jgi:hypothetical protein
LKEKTMEINTTALEASLYEAIERYDIILNNVAIARKLLPGEIPQFSIPKKNQAAFVAAAEPEVIKQALQRHDYLYPPVSEFEAEVTFDNPDRFDYAIDKLALTLVRKKEKLFFRIVEEASKATEGHCFKHEVASINHCDLCAIGIEPIRHIRQALHKVGNPVGALYLDAGAIVALYQNKEGLAWFDPVTRREHRDAGHAGHLLGSPVITNAYRDYLIGALPNEAVFSPFAEARDLFAVDKTIETVRHVAFWIPNVREAVPDPSVTVAVDGDVVRAKHFSALVIGAGAVATYDHVLAKKGEQE